MVDCRCSMLLRVIFGSRGAFSVVGLVAAMPKLGIESDFEIRAAARSV
jgi:hypothetical protein